MLTLNVAEIKIQIDCRYHYILSDFRTFKTDTTKNPDLKVKIFRNENLSLSGSDLILNGEVNWYKVKSTGDYQIILGNDAYEASAILTVTNNWSAASIQFKAGEKLPTKSTVKALMELLFRNLILFSNGIVIHASSIKWKDKGILFTAPSGTGKSTQAELWKNFMGAEILNGDRPAIKLKEEIPTVYGTPWSGLTPVFTNKEALLSAIIILEQAPENGIRRLGSSEAVPFLLPRCFLPYYNDKMMETAMVTVEKILSRVPIYLLKCRPDREAVELVYECVK